MNEPIYLDQYISGEFAFVFVIGIALAVFMAFALR